MGRNIPDRANVEVTNEPTEMYCNEGDNCRHVLYRNTFVRSPTAGDSEHRETVTEVLCPIHGLNPDRIEPTLQTNKRALSQ